VLLAAVLGLLTAFSSTSAARLDRTVGCVGTGTITGPSFDYVICDVPDLDQIREQTATTPGLPGDGYNYCAPTATMNALAYLASHGAPALKPGDKDWSDPANYNEMSADIKGLGDLMGTTASAGTGDGYFNGLDQWLSEFQPGAPLTTRPFATSYMWASSNGTSTFAPNLQQMADDAIAGNIVIPNIIFMQYEKPSKPATGPEQWFDVGGHVVTMSSAKSPGTIGLHDPFLPSDDHADQSPYSEETYHVTPVASTFGYLDDTGKDVNFAATLLRIDDYPLDSVFGAGTQAYLWGYTILQPETITTWSLNEKAITRVAPGEPVESFTPAGGDPILEVALDPSGARDFYTERGSAAIWSLDTANGTSTRFADAGAQPELVAYGARSQRLFEYGGRHLAVFDASGKTVGSVVLDEAVDALVVNQATGDVLALSAESGRARIFDARLHLLTTVSLPRNAVAGTGAASLAVDNGLLYVHRDGNAAVAVVSLRKKPAARSVPAGVRFVRLADARGSKGLAVDDMGRIFVTKEGKLVEYLPNGRVFARSPFAGQAAGSSLLVTRGFSNASPSTLHFVDYLPPAAHR
jgi:hypothetical protein